MNKLFFLMVFLSGCASSVSPYLKVGTGLILNESIIEWDDKKANDSFIYKVQCKVELGIQNKQISYGIRHQSKCFVGFPFNNNHEYVVDQLFVDYKYVFKL